MRQVVRSRVLATRSSGERRASCRSTKGARVYSKRPRKIALLARTCLTPGFSCRILVNQTSPPSFPSKSLVSNRFHILATIHRYAHQNAVVAPLHMSQQHSSELVVHCLGKHVPPGDACTQRHSVLLRLRRFHSFTHRRMRER